MSSPIRLPLGPVAIAAALVLSGAGSSLAAPAAINRSPAPLSSSASTAPTISFDLVDPAVGVDPDSIVVIVDGVDVTASVSLQPIIDGLEVSYVPGAGFADGVAVAVEIRAADLAGDPIEAGWSFYTDMRYPVGTIVLDTSHGSAGEREVYDAYGLAARLAATLTVDWVIDEEKSYEGVDLLASVDDDPDGQTPGADGTVLSKSYQAGPFLIRDPDPATTYNEAWDALQALIISHGYAANIDEVRTDVTISRRDVQFLTYRARIASHDKLSRIELDLAQIPHSPVDAPGEVSEPSTVAGGGLFHPTSDPVCGRQPRFDLTIQGHYDWDGPGVDESVAIAEFDEFIAKAGMSIFECASASIENTSHWITRPPEDVVEGAAVSPNYTPDATRYSHPFLQTMDPIPVQGGGFSIWDVDQNEMRPNLQNILFDAGNGDIGYVFGAVGSGKTYYMGGHRRSDLSDRRLVLNAFLYNVIYPKYRRQFTPRLIVAGQDNLVAVDVAVRGGSESLANQVVERFGGITTLVPDSVRLLVPGSTYAWDEASKTLTIDLGDFHPYDYPGGVVASYQVQVHPQTTGPIKVLDHSNTYTDVWDASYRFDFDGCGDIRAMPHLDLDKRADVESVVVDQPVHTTLRLLVSNWHSDDPLNTLVVTDTLPAGVSFSPGSIWTSKGTADWGVTTADTLTWTIPVLLPGEQAELTFEIDFAATATGPFTVNDGAHVSSFDRLGEPLSATSDDVVVDVEPDDIAVLDFALTPDLVPSGESVGLTFCATNIGRKKKFDRDVDELTLTIPAAFGVPTGVAAPAGWTSEWDAVTRSLTFRHASGDLDWEQGIGYCFTFELVTPDWPVRYDFLAEGSIDKDKLSYVELLPVLVERAPGFTLVADASGSSEACGSVSYRHTLRNDSNGVDVFRLIATSSEGYAIQLLEDVDLSGGPSAADTPLVDNDGDGVPDTSGVQPGASFALLVVIDIGNPRLDVTDVTTVEARSDDDTSLLASVTDTTDVLGHDVDLSVGDDRLCLGETTWLDAGAGYASYLWSTGETTPSIVVAPDETSSYSVEVSNALGCLVSDLEQIVIDVPEPAEAGADRALCVGTATSIGGAAAPGHDYAWTPRTGLDDASSASPLATPTATTTYTVTATDTATGCSSVDAVTVTVDTATADAGPDHSVCVGDAIAIGSPGLAGYSYSWSPAAGLDDPSAAAPTASPATTTTYTVTATDTATGCSETDTVTVTVNAAVADAGPDLSICRRQSIAIGSPAQPGYSYAWSPADTLDDPASSRPVASPTVTTLYTVSVTDEATGCSAVDVVEVEVVGADEPLPMGNVLLLTKANGRADVLHRWTEPAGALEVSLAVSSVKDRSDEAPLATVAAGGTADYLDAGAVSDPAPIRFYQVVGGGCSQ